MIAKKPRSRSRIDTSFFPAGSRILRRHIIGLLFFQSIIYGIGSFFTQPLRCACFLYGFACVFLYGIHRLLRTGPLSPISESRIPNSIPYPHMETTAGRKDLRGWISPASGKDSGPSALLLASLCPTNPLTAKRSATPCWRRRQSEIPHKISA